MGRFQIIRGLKENKKPLQEGEFFYATDTEELFLGKGNGDEVSFIPGDKVVTSINYHFMGAGSFKYIFNNPAVSRYVRKAGFGNLKFFYAPDISEEHYDEISEPTDESTFRVEGGGVLKITCDDETGNTAISIGFK